MTLTDAVNLEALNDEIPLLLGRDVNFKGEYVCLALKFVGSWVELGFSVGMEAFG